MSWAVLTFEVYSDFLDMDNGIMKFDLGYIQPDKSVTFYGVIA